MACHATSPGEVARSSGARSIMSGLPGCRVGIDGSRNGEGEGEGEGADNAYAHYRQHAEAVRAWLARMGTHPQAGAAPPRVGEEG
jgi:hypothetical protein